MAMPGMGGVLWRSEGCGVEWTISDEESVAFARMMRASASEVEEFRTQHAVGRAMRWRIAPLLATEPRGHVSLACEPRTAAATTSAASQPFAIFASEAEARLAVACYEFGVAADVPEPDAILAAANFHLDGKGDPGTRSFSRKLEMGSLAILLRGGGAAGRSLSLQFSPWRTGRACSIARISERPQPVAQLFALDVIAALSVAGARQARGALDRPLENGQEIRFIANLVPPPRGAAGTAGRLAKAPIVAS
jgi:hypothetical protein